MFIRGLGVVGLMLGAVLLTVWRLNGLNALLYGVLMLVIVGLILALIFGMLRIADPNKRTYRRKMKR